MALLAPVLKHRFFDSNGAPLSGGKLYSYAAGTSTPLNTYADSSGLIANTNPIILDSSGEAVVWLGSSPYKFVLKDALDITQWTVDDIVNVADIADGSITTSKIADSAVTLPKIATDSISTTAIVDGNVTTAKIADGAITQAKRAALGQQLSSSSGSYFYTGSTGTQDVTNLSVTITTTGRPVYVGIIHDGSGGPHSISFTSATANLSAIGFIYIKRDATTLVSTTVGVTATADGSTSSVFNFFPTNVFTFDVPAAGTYTYKISAGLSLATSTMSFAKLKLFAYEL